MMIPHFGLENAPVTRSLILVCTSCSLVLGLSNNVRSHWRLAIAFGCRHRVDAVLFVILLFILGRNVERRRGSRSFGGQIVATAGVLIALRPLMQTAQRRIPEGLLAVSLIASLLVPFGVNVPPIQRISFLNVNLTDKVVVYSLGLNVLVNDRQRLVPVLIGYLVGLLYEVNPLDVHTLFQLPRWCISLLGGSDGQPIVKYPAVRDQEPQEGSARLPQSQSHTAVQVSSEAMSRITAMGISEERAQAALQQVGGNDVEAAVASLF